MMSMSCRCLLAGISGFKLILRLLLQRQAVGYDPSRMLAPRAPQSGAASAQQRLAVSDQQGAIAAGSAARRLAAHLSGAQPMEIDAQQPPESQHHRLVTTGGGWPQQRQQPALQQRSGSGGGQASDSEDSYASAELVSRMRATAASAADLFAAAEAVLRRPAPPAPGDSPQPEGDGSWPAGLAATPDQRRDSMFGAVAAPAFATLLGAAAAAGGDCDGAGAAAAAFRLELAATPSPTSSKENEGVFLTVS